jgi:hypothetical protein
VKDRSSGSLTIEAAIILPTVFAVLIMSLWFVFIMYQNLNLTISAQDTARVSAQNWGRLKDVDLSTGNFRNNSFVRVRFPNFYWRIISNPGARENISRQYAQETSDHTRLLKPDYSYYNSDLIAFPRKIVVVDISERYRFPIAFVGNGYTYSVSARSVVSEPAELARNIDFIAELIDAISHSSDGDSE